MDDAKDFLSKYWPYIVGAVVGLYLILKFSGGNSASNSTDYASLLAAQAAASQQNAQIGMAQQAQQSQVDLANKQIDSQNAIANKSLDLQASAATQQFDLQSQAASVQAQLAAQQLQIQKDAQNAQVALTSKSLDIQSQVAQMQAQAQLAQAASVGTSQILASLYAPSITAINATTAENSATAQAAALTAAASYQAQQGIVTGTSNSLQAMAQAVNTWGTVAQGIASQPAPQSMGSQVAQAAMGIGTALLPASHWSNSQFGYFGI